MHGPVNRVPGGQLRDATQQHYEPQSWALTRVEETTVTECPPASGRVRDDGAPAFLKPFSHNNNPLPALVTILHSIPQCRNIFLAPNYGQESYAVSGDWWNAEPSSMPSYKSYRNEHLVREMQRLTAFLDRTQRAYGSAAKLQDLGGWQYDGNDKNVCHWFPAIMDTAYNEQNCTPLGNALKSEWQGEGEVPSTDRYHLTINDACTRAWSDANLYDALDTAIFSYNQLSLLLIPASVQVIHLKVGNPSTKVIIPPWLYLGRYGFDKMEIAKAALQDFKKAHDARQKVLEELEDIKYMEEDGKRYEALKVMRTAMRAFQPDKDGNFSNPNHRKSLEQLQQSHDFVARRIQGRQCNI